MTRGGSGEGAGGCQWGSEVEGEERDSWGDRVSLGTRSEPLPTLPGPSPPTSPGPVPPPRDPPVISYRCPFPVATYVLSTLSPCHSSYTVVPMAPFCLSPFSPVPFDRPCTPTPSGSSHPLPSSMPGAGFSLCVRGGEGTGEGEEAQEVSRERRAREGEAKQIDRKRCTENLFFFLIFSGRTRLHSSVCNFFLHAKITRPIC